VEQIGIERAWGQIEKADAVVFLHDLTRAQEAEYREADAAIAGKLPRDVPVVDVWNKLDALVVPASAGMTAGAAAAMAGIQLSARTGEGLDHLRRKLLEIAGWQAAPEGVFIARERHLHALRRVDAHLMEAAAHLARAAQALDLLAEELRLAQNALCEITGEFSADDLLGVIFSRFCIGK
jgi:tRNA modification GTPase